jgi:hypothetical protein
MSAFKFRRKPVRRRWLLSGTFVLTAAVFLFVIASASGTLTGSPSSFEANDGDMVHSTGTHDWDNVSFDHVADLASSQSDDSFVSGQKQDTVCPDTTLHGNPPKDDFTDVASYSETATAAGPQKGHTFLYGATIRYTANGNASENVELKQGHKDANGDLATCGNGLLQRTAGDKLVAIDYLGGGSSVDIHVLTWIDGTDATNPTCFVGNDLPPCWGAVVQHPTSVEGKASAAAILAANNPINHKALVAGAFAEFGVDLSAPDVNIIPANTCKAFPQTVWESRSSGSSFVSTAKDLAIENHAISNCGEIKIIKQTNPRGIDQRFSFTSNLLANTDAGGVACSDTVGAPAGVDASGNFCLNDAGNSGKTLGSTAAAQNSAGNTVDENNLPPNTYTITEGADPTGFAFDSITCTGGTTSKSGKVLTVTLASNDVVVCVYQNNQQQGAIKITKTSSKAAATPLAGAHFELCTNAGPYNTGPNNDQNPCSVVTGASDLVTLADGTVCKDGLGFNTYYVHEKTAPSGYAIDDGSGRSVTVSHNAKCSDATYVGESITFTDTPLTDIVAKATSQVAGGTASRVTCVDSANANVGNSPDPSASTFGDPAEVDANDLLPGTYTCTIIIDP